jgi:dienelactone hydrolase
VKRFTQAADDSGRRAGGRGVARLVVALELVLIATGAAAADPPTTAEVLAPGPYGVGHVGKGLAGATVVTLTDAVRSRELVVEIWYPAALLTVGGDPHAEQQEVAVNPVGAPYPLVVYSHGFLSSSSEGTLLNRHLASHGYVVVAPTFPFTNLQTPGGADVLDVVNQPGDVRFLVDSLLAWNLEAGNRFEGSVDGDRIGFAGLSLGGLTTLLATYHRDLRDPRVSVAVPIAAPGDFLGEGFYDFASVPLLLLAADHDAIVSYPHNALAAYARADLPKHLVTLLSGSHTGWSVFGPLVFEREFNPDTVGCGALVGQLPGEGGGGESVFVGLLGGEEVGIVAPSAPAPCTGVPAGWLHHESMRPSRQHALTIAAVRPFLDLHLSTDPARQQAAADWLANGLAAQNPDVHVCEGSIDVVCLPEPGPVPSGVAALVVLGGLRADRRRRGAIRRRRAA